MKFRASFLCAAISLVFLPSHAETPTISPARVAEIAATLPPEPRGFGAPISDREAWRRVSTHPALKGLLGRAEKLAASPVPELSDDLYLDFSRTGNRDAAQKVIFERATRLTFLTLAECLENKGRFVPALQQLVEALCREKAWPLPAHDGGLQVFHGHAMNPDLRATTLAADLATASYLLGDKLPPATRELLRDNVRRRVLQPFRDALEGRAKEIGWMKIHNNWNAVCLAGTVGAALALEDSPRDRAWFAAAAEKLIQNFLDGFTPDGYCSEGVGYWNYGFGHFITLTEELRQATAGKLDLFTRPGVPADALFAFRSEIINGVYPTISDVKPGAHPDPTFAEYVSRRLNAPLPPHLGKPNVPLQDLGMAAMLLFPADPLPVVRHLPPLPDSPLRTWFPNGGLLIARPPAGQPTPFAVALKGGANNASHNHNDAGSFSVVLGRTMVICDPGGEVYTRRTFGPHRYDSKVINSFGHAVPVVAGQLERPGAEARAVVVRTNFTDQADTLVLEMSSAYTVPDLTKLERAFEYRRDAAGSLRVADDVAFLKPETFESALITWGKWRTLAPNIIEIQDHDAAVQVKIDTGGLPFEVRAEEIDEHVQTPVKPWHLGIALKQPVLSARVVLDITPVPASERR